MKFSSLNKLVHAQFSLMLSTGSVFTVDVSKDELWDTYINSFAPEDNPIFRERTEHDCNCCKRYIRAAANAVAFIDGKLVTMWDVNVGGRYQPVVEALAAKVRKAAINGIFIHGFDTVGSYQQSLLNQELILLPLKVKQ